MAVAPQRVVVPRLPLEGGRSEALEGERPVGQQGRGALERAGDRHPGRKEAVEGLRLEERLAQQRLDLDALRRRERRPDLEVGGGEQTARLALGRRELARDDQRALPVLRQRVDPRVARPAALETDRGAEEHRRLPARRFFAQRLAGELAGREQALGGGRRAGLAAHDLEVEEAGGEDQPGGGRVAFAAHAHAELGEVGAGEPQALRLRGEAVLSGEPASVVGEGQSGKGGHHQGAGHGETAPGVSRGATPPGVGPLGGPAAASATPRQSRGGLRRLGLEARPVVRRGSSDVHGREGPIMTHPGSAFRPDGCGSSSREMHFSIRN